MRPAKSAFLLGCLVSLAFSAAPDRTIAQTPPPVPIDPPLSLEALEVTGSHIANAEDALSAPLTVIGREEIARTGLGTSLLEILQKRLPQFSGSNNLGPANAGANISATGGGSQVALRNLGTLVLLNGRRISDNGLAGRGGRSFVDISQIPVAAIERIEILPDGASAIYGSDAVGGVVNVVLRSRFRGIEAGGRHAFSLAEGHYSERSVFATAGAGDDRLDFVVSGSWSKTSPIFQSERAFSRPMRGSTATIPGAIGEGVSFPTHFLDPALNSPRERNPTGLAATADSIGDLVANGTYQPATFARIADTLDLAPYVTLLLGRESRSAFGSFDARLAGPRLEFFGDALYTRNESFSQVAPQFTLPNLTAPAGSPYNPLTVDFPQIAFRYLPAPRSIDLKSTLGRATLGLRGELSSDWRWQIAHTHSGNDSSLQVRNVFYGPNLTRAIAGGHDADGRPVAGGAYSRVLTGFSETGATWALQPALDPFARAAAVDPAALNHVLGTVFAKFRASLTQLDATVSGSLFDLPAGSVRVALGTDYRHERLRGEPDENLRNTGPTARRWIGAPYSDPFDRARDIHAVFGEIRVPVTGPARRYRALHALDLDAAYRIEDYNDAGRSSVPKFGVRWQPWNENFTMRYTFSKSFQAPTLYSLFGPVTQSFAASSIMPSLFGVSGAPVQQTGSSDELRPSTARTHSLGFVWSPSAINGLTFGVDFAAIDQVDVTGTRGAAAILHDVNARGSASVFAAQVALFAFPGQPGAQPITAVNQIRDWLQAGNAANSIFVLDTQRNLAGQRARALDVRADYRFVQSTRGVWTFATTGTFFIDHAFQTSSLEPFYEYAGFATRGGSGTQGTIPDYRFRTSIDWQGGNWQAGLGHSYVSSVLDVGTGGEIFARAAAGGTTTPLPVAPWSVFDLRLSYTFSPAEFPRWLTGVTLTAGTNNLTDRAPPRAPRAFDDNHADTSTYDPIGRLWYVSATARF